jgi:UDPglucose 6-dehydrogenase
VVVAGKKKDVDLVMSKVFYWQEKKIPVYHVDLVTAVMTKLVMNAFAATKISFANEVRRLCEDYGVDPRVVMNILVSEGRAAPEYTDPMKGPFYGKCLPKDLEELINCSEKTILLRAVKEVNEEVKKDLDKK